jgi:glycine hydroxymethyltransferase
MIMIRHDIENPFGITNPKGNLRMLSELIDLAVFPGTQGGPLEHVIAAKAIAYGEALSDSFLEYCHQIRRNAQTLANAMVTRGYQIISGGTDNHLMLIDLRNKGITGKLAQETLIKADITINKNAVPFDDKSPFVTSGMRLGVSALTSRGLKEQDMERVADWIDRALLKHDDAATLNAVKTEINKAMQDFPLFAW